MKRVNSASPKGVWSQIRSIGRNTGANGRGGLKCCARSTYLFSSCSSSSSSGEAAFRGRAEAEATVWYNVGREGSPSRDGEAFSSSNCNLGSPWAQDRSFLLFSSRHGIALWYLRLIHVTMSLMSHFWHRCIFISFSRLFNRKRWQNSPKGKCIIESFQYVSSLKLVHYVTRVTWFGFFMSHFGAQKLDTILVRKEKCLKMGHFVTILSGNFFFEIWLFIQPYMLKK